MDDDLMKLAVRIATESAVEVPDDCVVAVFIFRNEPEIDTLHTGYVSMTPVGRLHQWLDRWWDGVKPKPATKETIQ